MSENWQVKHFNQLTTDELYDFLKLRIDVFVVEQTCYYPDLDDLDRHCETLHVFKYIDDEIAAYLRILPKGTTYQDFVSIGRVIIAPKFRGQALGHELISLALETTDKAFPKQDIKISAQLYLEKFYQNHGFETCSEMYLEDGIEHIGMKLLYAAPKS